MDRFPQVSKKEVLPVPLIYCNNIEEIVLKCILVVIVFHRVTDWEREIT